MSCSFTGTQLHLQLSFCLLYNQLSPLYWHRQSYCWTQLSYLLTSYSSASLAKFYLMRFIYAHSMWIFSFPFPCEPTKSGFGLTTLLRSSDQGHKWPYPMGNSHLHFNLSVFMFLKYLAVWDSEGCLTLFLPHKLLCLNFLCWCLFIFQSPNFGATQSQPTICTLYGLIWSCNFWYVSSLMPPKCVFPVQTSPQGSTSVYPLAYSSSLFMCLTSIL
jgi:hypothetical protein